MNPLDLEQKLVRARGEVRERRYAVFDPEILAWLVLLPEWTDELAVALGLGDPKRVGALIDQLDQAELIERRVIISPDGQQGWAFELRSAERADLANYLRVSERIDAGGALTRLAQELERVPDADGPWPRLLLDINNDYRFDPTGLRLISTLNKLVEQGALKQAFTLVQTVQVVAELLGGALEETAERARWRLDRAYREQQDRRYLEHYITRAPVEEAIEALLDGDEHWALHLIGSGGSGKTMVVRYLISGRFAADRSRSPLAVARIDFDHVDPSYPEHRPAELLLAFADELLGYGKTRDFAALYKRFKDSAVRLHEEITRLDEPTGNRALETGALLRQTVHQFGLLLDEVHEQVVLVLDTCEELAKLYPPGAPASGIDYMFQLLELLHDIRPLTRVLLSGRRRLTPAPDARQAAAGPQLLPRPYLRVLVMPGFTAHEADRYVNLRVPGIAPAVRAALMDRARDPADWYNPFDLNAYCEWALAEPLLEPGLVRLTDGDSYIERRIMARLDEQVRMALPVVVALGSFNRALVEPALERLGVDPGPAFAGLAAQEWVTVRAVDEAGRPAMLEIDAAIRSRLFVVVSSHEQVDLPRLGADAEALVDRTPLTGLASEVVEAAVRLLPPPAAAEFWQRIERRIVGERSWGWAAAVVSRAGAALAEQSAAADQTILAAVLATQASVGLHADPHGDQGAIWRSVAETMARYPDLGKRMLAGRAAAGLLRAGEQADLDDLADAPDDAVLAAAEALQARDERLPAALIERLCHTDPAAQTDLTVAVQLAMAWHYLCDGRDNAAIVATHVALAALRRAPATAGSYADWIPPADVGSRCLLGELVVTAVSGRESALVISHEELRRVLGSVSGIDGERLASLAIDLLARRGPVEPELLIAAEEADRYVAGRLPDSWPHRMTRPLVVAIAEAWSVQGEPERAAHLLRERIAMAVTAGGDVGVVNACQLALLRLCRRYRTTRFAESVHRLAEEGSRAVRAEAWLVRALVRGERPLDPVRAGSFYAWWRCLDATSALPVSVGPVREFGLPSAGGAANTREFEKLTGREARSALPDEPGLRVLPETLAEVLRFHAVLSPELRDRYPGLPPFLFGRAALEAGEVLALRLPAEGATLLRAAAAELHSCGDRLGAAQAGVLAALAARRAGALDTATIPGLPEVERLAMPDWGWAARLSAARSGQAESRSASPEFPAHP
jgi:hypothetical protein